MKKVDFVWTVGYQGEVAQVNASRKKAYPNPSAMDLLAQGLLRPAFCAALWEEREKPGFMDTWLSSFSQKTGLSLGLEEIKRLLGVYVIPADTVKTKAL